MKTKKIIAAVVTLTLVFGAAGNVLNNRTFFGTELTAGAEAVYSEKCGENVTWEYDEAAGTLTISGTGDMWEDVDHGGRNIWDTEEAESYEWLLNVKSIIIKDGVTSLSAQAFADSRFKNVENIEIPASVETIGINAFNGTGKWRNNMRESNNGIVVVNDMLVDASFDISALVIPEGVKKISAGALYYSDITSIVVPKSCTEICENALPAKRLQHITFLNPDTVIDDASEYERTIRNSYTSGDGSVYSGVVYGYEGSKAEEYANDYCTFKPIIDDSVATAKYDINYGGLSINKDTVVPSGAEITMPDVPDTPSYVVFKGWKTGEETYNTGDKFVLKEDKTFTAQWDDTRKPLEKLEVRMLEPVIGEELHRGAEDKVDIRIWTVEVKTTEYYDDQNRKQIRYDTVNLEGTVIWNTTTAEPNSVATAKFNIQGNKEYKITDDTKVVVNGRKATIEPTGIDNTYEVTVKFVFGEKEDSSVKPDSSSSKPDSSKPDSSAPEKKDAMLGDVNGDKNIDIEDAVMVINHVNGAKALNDEESKRANVDGNSAIDIEDAVAIIGHVNGLKPLN